MDAQGGMDLCMIKIGDYRLCVLDLVCDHKTGRLDKVSIWYHIANIIMSKTMLTQQNIGWELLATYGAIVGGSYAAILFMKWRYRDVSASNPDMDVEKP